MKGQFNNTSYLLLAIVFLLSVFGAVWQGQYSVDNAHWGSMISNSKDLVEGLLPYKDIYILYGILTTTLHAIAYKYLFGNLQSLILMTSLFYAIGLIFVYLITKHIEGEKKIAAIVVTTYFLIHPFAIYPWSNYLAFPLLLFGLLQSLMPVRSARCYFFSGIAFALAVLTREGLLPPVLVYMVLVIIINVLNEQDNQIKQLKLGIISLLGFMAPILIFFAYLITNNIFDYWKTMSWNLPQLYAAEFFPHMKGIGMVLPFIKQVVKGILNLDVRWMVILLMVVINATIIMMGTISGEFRRKYSNNVKIALFSILLISSALHLPEIFRIATGGMIGLINFYSIIRKVKFQNILFLILAFALVLTIAPSGSGDSFNTTNYFWPSEFKIKNTHKVINPIYFKNQKWENDATDFYNKIELDLKNIHDICSIKYHYNMTQDSFLVVISPFERYQIAAHWTSDSISQLRPDLDINKKLETDRDILIFQELANDGSDITKIPKGFVLYKKYKTPKTPFFYRDASLNIIIPEGCKKELTLR